MGLDLCGISGQLSLQQLADKNSFTLALPDKCDDRPLSAQKEINFPLVPGEIGAEGSEAGIFIDYAYLQ